MRTPALAIRLYAEPGIGALTSRRSTGVLLHHRKESERLIALTRHLSRMIRPRSHIPSAARMREPGVITVTLTLLANDAVVLLVLLRAGQPPNSRVSASNRISEAVCAIRARRWIRNRLQAGHAISLLTLR